MNHDSPNNPHAALDAALDNIRLASRQGQSKVRLATASALADMHLWFGEHLDAQGKLSPALLLEKRHLANLEKLLDRAIEGNISLTEATSEAPDSKMLDHAATVQRFLQDAVEFVDQSPSGFSLAAKLKRVASMLSTQPVSYVHDASNNPTDSIPWVQAQFSKTIGDAMKPLAYFAVPPAGWSKSRLGQEEAAQQIKGAVAYFIEEVETSDFFCRTGSERQEPVHNGHAIALRDGQVKILVNRLEQILFRTRGPRQADVEVSAPLQEAKQEIVQTLSKNGVLDAAMIQAVDDALSLRLKYAKLHDRGI